jgi:prepilin-type N-terminal cleavage/methylation domain-containing protein
MNNRSSDKKYTLQKSFTLLELLVVTVILVLLITLILVNTRAGRARGRDGRRVQDIKQIILALQLYAEDYDGMYPHRTDPLGAGGWETSDIDPDLFLEYLAPYFGGAGTPVDPTNKRITGFTFFGPRPGNYFYAYAEYGIPYDRCPEINTPFAVIAINNLEEFVLPGLPEENMPLPEYIDFPRAQCGDPGSDGICTVAEYQAGQCRDWSQEFDYSVMLVE